MTRRLSFLLVLFQLVTAGGCADIRCGLEVCDIFDRECQQTIAEATACLRGNSAIRVPVRIVAQDDFLDDALGEAGDEAEPEAFALWNTAFALWNTAYARFGLAATDADEIEIAAARAERTGAFYSPQDGQITVIDGGRAMDTRGSVALLVHEIVHALQDQEIGLEDYLERNCSTLDGCLAADALVEGEASLIESLAAVELFGTDPDEVPWGEVASGFQDRSRAALYAEPSPIYLSRSYFSYAFGLQYAAGAWETGGMDAVADLYGEPPDSTRQVMAGYDAEAPGRGPWLDPMNDVSSIDLPGYAPRKSSRLGAFVFELFLASCLDPDQYADKIPESGAGLAGDRFWILEDEETRQIVAVWRLRFTSEKLAASWLDRFPDGIFWYATRSERDLVMIGAGSWWSSFWLRDAVLFGPG